MTIELSTISALEVGSQEWHKARRVGLGGSEVAAALGYSQWVSPFTLWHRKRGNVGPGEETPSMYWGKRLEPAILAEYCRRHPGLHAQTGRVWVVNGWQIISPDATIHDPINERTLNEDPPTELWEGKTADAHDWWQWGPDGSDQPEAIPKAYRVQALWYMDGLGVYRMRLSVLIGGNDYREYIVPWDDAEAADIRERAAAFHQTILDGIEPDLDTSSGTYDTVREMHPNIDLTLEVEVPAEYVNAWREHRDAYKHHKGEATRNKALVVMHMQSARYGLIAGTRAVRRQSMQGRPPHPVLVETKETRHDQQQ